MKKTFSIGVLALAFAVGLASCNKDKTAGLDPQAEGNTFASVSIAVQGSGLRAGDEDYNSVGDWAGQDVIEKVAVYLVADGTVHHGLYTKDEFDITPAKGNGTQNIIITPKKGIKTTAGEKKVYVLINGTKEAEDALAETDPNAFEKAYAKTALALANKGGEDGDVSTSADKFATYKDEGGKKYDQIVMTNSAESKITVKDGVKETETLDKGATKDQNRVSVSVKRTVARVLVTTTAENYTIKNTITNTDLGEISDIKWVLAQGEASLYLQQKASFETPNFSFVTSGEEDDNNYKKAIGKYDYSGLYRGYNKATSTTAIQGMDVPTGEVLKQGNLGFEAGKVAGEFILPTTHEYGATREATKYRKGNTPYVLIRAKFTPKEDAYADKGEQASSTEEAEKFPAGTFWVGANGKFYKNYKSVTDPNKGGVKGQTARKYVGGKVLYWAWLNPDKTDSKEWLNSPVLRNNIYHININGFKSLGLNWNPLVPNDPKTPKDPKNPGNPDPKPGKDPNGPDEPTDDPIKPEDPLSTPETYMSVDIKVLSWKVHSYGIELDL